RGIMEQRDPQVGLEPRQRPLEPVGQHLRMAHECLHLRFAEVTAVSTAKPTAESLGARDADPGPVDIDRGGFTFEYAHPCALEGTPDLVLAVGVVVMVAEDGDHRDRHPTELVGQDLYF